MEIVIRVSEEKVVVEVPEKGWRKEYANCLTLSENGTILSIGKSETELQEITRQKGLKEMSDLKFLPIYDTESFDPDFFTQSFQFFTGNAQDEAKSSAFGLFDRIDLKVWLPENYESDLVFAQTEPVSIR
ncbi:MAG TPA: hypothetical protein PK530_23580 [Anaerolineales bacterium]|nr:hypothetical protein [Anaerolineales bacterium]